MRDELCLAERNYGVVLDNKRHRDLIDQNRGRVAVLKKLLAEARRTR
jgi:hypothetical protein